MDSGGGDSHALQVRLKLRPIRAVGWVTSLLGVTLFVGLLLSEDRRLAPVALIFVAMGLYLILHSPVIGIDSEGIRYATRFARHAMRWEEVKRVTMDGQGYAVVYHGARKRLAMIGPLFWGSDGPQLGARLEAEFRRRNLGVEEDPACVFQPSKNTRVPKGAA